MLTREGVAKIGDFAIARHVLGDQTLVKGMLGSPRYMSHEQVGD